jgi:hypothetical protein
MPYPQLSGEPNFILIGVSAVFGLLVIIIVYYIFISKNSSSRNKNSDQNQLGYSMNPNMTLASNNNGRYGTGSSSSVGGVYGSNIMSRSASSSAPVPINTGGVFSPAPTGSPSATVSNPNIKQVFNIKENIYTLDDAPGVCGALGADVASINQLIDSHKQGADWCNVGWTKDGLAAYPIQYSTWKTLQDNEPSKRNICGAPGINLARNDPNLLYGVNCYGVKPEPKGNEKVKESIISDKQLAINASIANFQKNINAIGVIPFNASRWSE